MNDFYKATLNAAGSAIGSNVGSNVCGQKALAPAIPEIHQSISDLGDALMQLDGCIDLLVARLAPASRQSPPEVSNQKETRLYDCELARIIADKKSHVDSLIQSVNRQLQQLEI